MAPFLDIKEEDWDKTIAISLKTAFLGCQAEALAMIAHDTPGRIINVSSAAGVTSAPGNAAYGAAKAGVRHLTKTLGMELAKWGIRVNCIVPGSMELASGKPSASGTRFHGVWSVEDALKNTAMRRFGRAEETASLSVFFASKLSSYVTGISLASDGGLLLNTHRPEPDQVSEVAKQLGKEPLFIR